MSEKEAGSVVTSANAEEFYANRLGLAEEAPVEAVEEKSAEPTEEANDQSEQPTEEIETKATEEKKQNPKLEKRFSELTKQREEARKEAAKEREARESLESRIKELEGRAEQKPVEENVKPSPGQFNDAFEYAEALAEWSAENALLNRDKAEAERKVQDERSKVIKSWNDRLVNVKADLPDYDEMIASAADITVNDAIRDAMLESEQGPRILYHLAENPELADKLNTLSTVSALREIGKLEAKFEASETPKDAKTDAETKPSIARSKAPAPISPIKTSSAVADVGVGSDGEFHGTYQQWRESRKAGKIR
jgi:chromosome segregation ATPase